MSEDWLSLLQGLVDRLESKQAAASFLGVSRTAVSLALAGKYKGNTDSLRAKVLKRLMASVECPHLKRPIPLEECTAFRTRKIPSHGVKEHLDHWLACQRCPIGDQLGIPRDQFFREEAAHAQR